ncbi:unnamed protein product, partial [Symbiodinium microadriaticum]
VFSVHDALRTGYSSVQDGFCFQSDEGFWHLGLELEAGSAQMVASVRGSEAAQQSPSELPVPTDKPSPTSPVVKPKAAAVAGASCNKRRGSTVCGGSASADLLLAKTRFRLLCVQALPEQLWVPLMQGLLLMDKIARQAIANVTCSLRTQLLTSPCVPVYWPFLKEISVEVPESAAAKMSTGITDGDACAHGRTVSDNTLRGETVTVPTADARAVPTAYTPTRTAPEVPRVTLRPRVAREAPTAEPPMEEAGMSTQPCSSSSGAVADVAGGGLALFSFVEPLSAKKGPVRDEADEVPLGPPIAGRLEGRFKFAGVFANRSVAAREAMRSRCGACAAGGVIPSQVVQDFLPVLQDVVQVIPESEVPPPMQVLRQPRSPTAPQVPTDVPSPTSPAVSSPPVEDDAEVEVPVARKLLSGHVGRLQQISLSRKMRPLWLSRRPSRRGHNGLEVEHTELEILSQKQERIGDPESGRLRSETAENTEISELKRRLHAGWAKWACLPAVCTATPSRTRKEFEAIIAEQHSGAGVKSYKHPELQDFWL